MEIVKSHIQKCRPESEPGNKNMDLDEKIRRIKEANKATEKRFKEVEDDKQQASRDSISDEKNKQEKAMKGVIAIGGRKMTKGRGQRLLEMSKEPLKAKEFELRARENKNKIEECNQPEESKFLTQLPKETKRVEWGAQQSKKEKKEAFSNTEIPSVGFNPLMDDRYIDKKDISKRRGDHKVGNDTKQTRGGQGQKQDRPKLREARKTNNSQRKALEEDKSIDVIDVGELKTESITNRKLKVSEQTNKVSTGSDTHEEDIKKNTDLSENTDAKKNNATGHVDNHKRSLGEICDKFHDQTVLQDSKTVDRNKKLPDRYVLKEDRSNTREVLTGENDSQQTIAAIPEEQEKSFEVEKLPSTKNTKPKITVDTKLKKTLSNSSFDDSMSMLSPLDVPKDWGDCDFDESLSEVPSAYYQQTLTFD